MEGEGDLKAPRRDHLKVLARHDPEAAAELAQAASCPAAGAHIWRYFLELSRTRQNGGMGPSRLSRLEIRLWEADECVSLSLWERRAIIDLDGVWFAAVSDQIAAATPAATPPTGRK